MPRIKPKKADTAKRPVPAYMMSYGDMMTLLLTFFILLVSMAKEQRCGLMSAGTGSFVRALDSLGLPGILPGATNPTIGEHLHPNFAPVASDAEAAPGERLPELVAPRKPAIRHAYVDSRQPGRTTAFAVPVSFRPGTAELGRESLEPLNEFADLVEQTHSYVAIEAFVATGDDGWELSALRAAAVARHLHQRGNISFRRITTIGYGRFHPVGTASPARGAPANERVNIRLCRDPID